MACERVEPNDWEGMDSFEFDDRHYLLIGDTGDNFRKKRGLFSGVGRAASRRSGSERITVSWQTSFRFPDGPKDVEAVAVDPEGKLAIFLNKRELPLRLYSVPLFPINGEIVAKKMAELVPVPRYRSDLEVSMGQPRGTWVCRRGWICSKRDYLSPPIEMPISMIMVI